MDKIMEMAKDKAGRRAVYLPVLLLALMLSLSACSKTNSDAASNQDSGTGSGAQSDQGANGGNSSATDLTAWRTHSWGGLRQ